MGVQVGSRDSGTEPSSGDFHPGTWRRSVAWGPSKGKQVCYRTYNKGDIKLRSYGEQIKLMS